MIIQIEYNNYFIKNENKIELDNSFNQHTLETISN